MSFKTYVGLLVLMLVGLVAGTEYATNWIDIKPADSGGVAPAEGRMFWNTSSQQVNVYDANLQPVGLDGRLACDYLVYTNGTHYFAKNCSTGVVDSDTNFSRLVSGLDKTIIIKRGNYTINNATIILHEGDSLIADNNVWFILSGSEGYIYSESNNVIVRNIKFDASNSTADSVIRMRGKRNIIIDNVEIYNAYKHGIWFSQTSAPFDYSPTKIVKNSKIYNYCSGVLGYAIYFDYSPGGVIERNYITGGGCDAIEIGNLGYYKVYRNTLNGTRGPISINFPFASNSVIAENLLINAVISNDVNEAYNVSIHDNVIMDATPTDGYAAIRYQGGYGYVYDNTILRLNASLGGFGMKILPEGAPYGEFEVRDNYIECSVAKYGKAGINVRNKTRVIGNTIRGCYIGIIFDWNNNTITNNMIYDAEIGIELVPSFTSGNVMKYNYIYGNFYENVSIPILPGNSVQIPYNLMERYNYSSLPTWIGWGGSNNSYSMIQIYYYNTTDGSYNICVAINEWKCVKLG